MGFGAALPSVSSGVVPPSTSATLVLTVEVDTTSVVNEASEYNNRLATNLTVYRSEQPGHWLSDLGTPDRCPLDGDNSKPRHRCHPIQSLPFLEGRAFGHLRTALPSVGR